LEESVGIGDLAVALAVCYQTKPVLANRSPFSEMGMQREEFLAAFGQTINGLILNHSIDLERRRWEQTAAPGTPPDHFLTEQSAGVPKGRWVDGTPEYSFHISGLRKLFPNALFIHIVRDVTSVVRSMLNFHRVSGVSLVTNEQEAYDYWFRAVSSCVLAEEAYGPGVVFRLSYSDLVDQPESSLRSLLNFVGEPFSAGCLTPLQKRINSSNEPHDFKLGSPGTDPAVVERATKLYAEIERAPPSSETSIAAADKIEAAFNQRVQYVAILDGEYAKAQQEIVALQIEREQMREGYEAEQRRLNAEREQMREGYEAEQRRLNAEREQMREGYEAEQRRLEAESARNAARAERLANEVKRKRAIIKDIRARGHRHELRRFFFGG
jgi:hypothetical protein